MDVAAFDGAAFDGGPTATAPPRAVTTALEAAFDDGAGGGPDPGWARIEET